jgi:hypothetical protein
MGHCHQINIKEPSTEGFQPPRNLAIPYLKIADEVCSQSAQHWFSLVPLCIQNKLDLLRRDKHLGLNYKVSHYLSE